MFLHSHSHVGSPKMSEHNPSSRPDDSRRARVLLFLLPSWQGHSRPKLHLGATPCRWEYPPALAAPHSQLFTAQGLRHLGKQMQKEAQYPQRLG